MVKRIVRLVALSMLIMIASVSAVAANTANFGTPLKGSEENPPRPSHGQGEARFKLSDDGTAIHYKLIASNIDNVVASHIHLGAPGVNGPIVVFLYGTAPSGGGRTDGVLAEG